MQIARLSKDMKLKNLEIFVPVDITRWKKEIEKIKKKQKSIKIDDKLPKKSAKTLARLQKKWFLI